MTRWLFVATTFSPSALCLRTKNNFGQNEWSEKNQENQDPSHWITSEKFQNQNQIKFCNETKNTHLNLTNKFEKWLKLWQYLISWGGGELVSEKTSFIISATEENLPSLKTRMMKNQQKIRLFERTKKFYPPGANLSHTAWWTTSAAFLSSRVVKNSLVKLLQSVFDSRE